MCVYIDIVISERDRLNEDKTRHYNPTRTYSPSNEIEIKRNHTEEKKTYEY